MNTNWNLDIFYTGLTDPRYGEDIAALDDLGDELIRLTEEYSDRSLADCEPAEQKRRAEALLTCMEERSLRMSRLFAYLNYRQSTDTEDGELMAQANRVRRVATRAAAAETAAERILGQLPDLEALAEISPLAAEYSFLLKQIREDQSHSMSDEEEALFASMDMTGGRAWSSLQAFMTSNVTADYNGRKLPLAEVRNLAFDPDHAVRRAAYEAELACYDGIQDAVAFALNNIKSQVTLEAEKRNFASPLEMTLNRERMDPATLEALIGAIREYLPAFRRYLKHKARKLGHEGGLPWYDLFAPMGSAERRYTPEECRETLTSCFRDFTPEMSDMMDRAFREEWIDFYPRKGKKGGAFCGRVAGHDQSRILTNYDGSFSSVDTLAHELGHAFHNHQLFGQRPMNQGCPMSIAETASTFNEIFLCRKALEEAGPEERLAILENDLREHTQVVVDILSRYLFETAVFETCGDKFLMASDLREMMLAAQREAYGDGLDPETLHPYMWVCKSHYYSSGRSFYNFPYAFGCLFSMGLYALYRKEGDAFLPKYKKMLSSTARATCEECGAMMGIDLRGREFWSASLELIAGEIEEYCQL